ncbi:hypothetical protein vseg_006424 [Gypsophila vaccaria]
MFSNSRFATFAVILLLASVPSYARDIPRRELRDAQLEELSLNEDPTMAVNLLEHYKEALDIKRAYYNIVQGGLQCLPAGTTCYFLYPELCCSGMCKLRPDSPFGNCLGN